jgi:hypothetical protein
VSSPGRVPVNGTIFPGEQPVLLRYRGSLLRGEGGRIPGLAADPLAPSYVGMSPVNEV